MKCYELISIKKNKSKKQKLYCPSYHHLQGSLLSLPPPLSLSLSLSLSLCPVG